MNDILKHCPTRLITDTPSQTDRFGTFGSVVKAISNLITTEDGGIAIGIEGEWGAGKSTLINLLKKQITEHSQDCEVIIFDAWAHQDDPLRRSFLETLIDGLSKAEWITSDTKTSKKDLLSRRAKVDYKTTSPILKPLGVAVGICSFLIPIGLAMFNSALRDGLTLEWSGWQMIHTKAVIGIIFSLSPVIVITIARIFRKYKKLDEEENNKDEYGSTLGSLLLHKYSTREITKTISEPNPTSVEFEEIFVDLMDEALIDNERRLVLVIDNLDRVEPHEAISILSTLHTFLQDKFSRDYNWFRRIWIAIPYSPDGLRQIWDSRKTKNVASISDGHEPVESGNSISQKLGISERFLEKRFQIRFEVPPIVLSDWGNYLQELLENALPEHPKYDAEFHDVYRIYDLTRPWSDLPPTPRDLKIFVNQIGALHRQWQDTYPLTCLAYYATLFLRRKDILKGLRSGQIPEKNVINLLGVDPTSILASLLFNTAKEKARELLLKKDIIKAITDGKIEHLDELSNNHPMGFWYVMGRVRFSDWGNNECLLLANLAIALNAMNFIDRDIGQTKGLLLNELKIAFEQVSIWDPLGKIIGEGIVGAISMTGDKDLAFHLVQTISDSGSQKIGDNRENQIEPWFESFLPAIEATLILPTDSVMPSKILLPSNPSWGLQICSRLSNVDSDYDYLTHFQIESNLDEIEEHIISVVSGGLLLPETVDGFSRLMTLVPEMEWEPMINALHSRLNSTATYEAGEIMALHRALWILDQANEDASNKLKNLVDRGQILHHLQKSKQSGSDQAIAICIFTQLSLRPDTSPPPQEIGESNAGWGYLNSVLNSPKENQTIITGFMHLVDEFEMYNILQDLMDKATQWKSWTFHCISKGISMGRSLRLFSSTTLIDKFDILKMELEESIFNQLLKELIESSDLIQQVTMLTFDTNKSELYVFLLRCGGDKSEEYLSWIVAELKKIDLNTWHNALVEESYLLNITVEVYKSGKRFSLGIAYRDGICKYAKDLLDGVVEPEDELILSADILKPIWRNDRALIRRKFLDLTIDASGNIPEGYFDVFGDEMSMTQEIESDKLIVIRLFEPLVESMNLKGLVWINDLLGKIPDKVPKFAPKYAVSGLRKRIKESLGNTDNEEFVHILMSIGQKLGMEFTPK